MSDIQRLLDIMARLRDPNGGCPWDLEQNFRTIAPYTIEEAYEVADAIEHGDRAALKDELGDLLLQVVFHAQMAREEGSFAFPDVVEAICDKLVRRHPHVFGETAVAGADEVLVNWEAIKRAERGRGEEASALDDVARGLPEWMRALKLQKRGAQQGFDWPDVGPVVAKLHEEIDEVQAEFARAPRDPDRLEDEIGDVLFVCVNLARHAKVDPGVALRRANAKFERRFRRMEALARVEGRGLKDLSLAEQEALWDRAKAEERGGGDASD
jgi:ATP diphosphatase